MNKHEVEYNGEKYELSDKQYEEPSKQQIENWIAKIQNRTKVIVKKAQYKKRCYYSFSHHFPYIKIPHLHKIAL